MADEEAKHQADDNKNLCLGYQAKTEADNKPLPQLNNEMTKAAPARVARHRNKVQDHRLTDEHLPGKTMPGSDASCHAAPIEDLDEEERERLMGDTAGTSRLRMS